jgi:undecaprenyl-diphosphatase
VAELELAAYRAIRGAARDPRTVARVRRFSSLGNHGACWIAIGAAGAALDEPRRARWLRALGAVGAAYLLNVAVKTVFRRRRPLLEHLPALVRTPTELSFPSSHAAAAFAGARAYAPLLPGGRALYAVAAAMGLSRIYLGVHYPSDIAAGAALGTVVGGVMAAR